MLNSMFRILRYIVELRWRIKGLENDVESLKSMIYRLQGRHNPHRISPYDLGENGGFIKKNKLGDLR